MKYAAFFLLIAISQHTHAFFVDKMIGKWHGETTSAYYAIKNRVPEYFELNEINVAVTAKGELYANIGNGCLVSGVIMRSSSTQYPIKGYIGGCTLTKLNGKFEGMFNSLGNIRMIVKDKKLGRADFYGKIVKVENNAAQ